MKKKRFIPVEMLLLSFVWILSLDRVNAQETTLRNLANEILEVQDINFGVPHLGYNSFHARFINKSADTLYAVVDIRTEGININLANYQRSDVVTLVPSESKHIELPYQCLSELTRRIILKIGKSEAYFDMDLFINLSREERMNNPLPKRAIFWNEKIQMDLVKQIEDYGRSDHSAYEIFLNPIQAERIARIKSDFKQQLDSGKRADNHLIARLKETFYQNRIYPSDFDKQASEWKGKTNYEELLDELNLYRDVFSISAEKDNRIHGFFITRNGEDQFSKPTIIILGGNPGGEKESVINRAIPFALAGYHVIGVERRPSARLNDSLEKFISNDSDPVSDVIRIIDFVDQSTLLSYSSLGLFGYSKGAMEGKFIAALDDRLDAVVLACGLSSMNSLFEDRERWIPTLSGFNIYPQIGLESPFEAGEELNSETYQKYFLMAKPEHNEAARKAYEKMIPEFNDFDALNVVPLIAPIPLMIVSGARDIQFTVDGVTEVDVAAERVYQSYGCPECYDLILEPRTGHSVDAKTSGIVLAFFHRWLD